MSTDAVKIDTSAASETPVFKGLEGVDALVNSGALEILRELGHGPEFRALLQLAGLVEEQEAALKAAA